MTRREEIDRKAVEILKSTPNGIRYSELVKRIKTEFPSIPIGTIKGTVLKLNVRLPKEIYKPDRGLFRYAGFREEELIEKEQPPSISEKVKEEEFYRPFADWLVNELEECTKAISLGGNKFKDKWGTPDVIGIREPRKSDIIKPPTEIISAEVKIDTTNLITAFGQACSFKLFSHKSYIVVPNDSIQEDITRLDALGRGFGIGLILFDRNKPKEPGFEIRVRATKHEPDMFYVNKYMKIIEDDLFS